MTFNEARIILDRYCLHFTNKEASTNTKPYDSANLDAANLGWWTEHDRRTPDWRTPRTVAYFCAYVEMAGRKIPMRGIHLEDGFVWPDRAVMRSLLERGCVRPIDEDFHVTSEGELLLAPVVELNGDEVTSHLISNP